MAIIPAAAVALPVAMQGTTVGKKKKKKTERTKQIRENFPAQRSNTEREHLRYISIAIDYRANLKFTL